MNKASDPVLEFLADHDIAVPIGVLDNELDVSYPTIARALPQLEKHGLIEKDEDYESYYRITEKGVSYLEGDLDASKLDPDNDLNASELEDDE